MHKTRNKNGIKFQIKNEKKFCGIFIHFTFFRF